MSFCFLTFHSTNSISKVNSIIKYGYLIPGMKHPTFGWKLSMSCSNLYGDGVYSSPDFNTSSWFSLLDVDKAIQIIVNLVLPGVVKIVTKNNWVHDNENNENEKKMNMATSRTIPEHYENYYEDSLGRYDTLI